VIHISLDVQADCQSIIQNHLHRPASVARVAAYLSGIINRLDNSPEMFARKDDRSALVALC